MTTEPNTISPIGISFPSEADYNKASTLATIAILTQKSENNANKKRTIIFPVHGLDNVGVNRPVSTYLAVRKTAHGNGLISYAFTTQWYMSGAKVSRKNMREFGYDINTALNGYRVAMFRTPDNKPAIKRVNKDGEYAGGNSDNLNLAFKWAKTSEILFQRANAMGLIYPDYATQSNALNLDRHAPIHFAGVVKLKVQKFATIDESELSDSEFDALFAAQ